MTRGRYIQLERIFTTRRLMINLLEVVLNVCFLAKTMRMETFIVMDAKKITESKVINTHNRRTFGEDSSLFSLNSLSKSSQRFS